jgi:hypothetical protein
MPKRDGNIDKRERSCSRETHYKYTIKDVKKMTTTIDEKTKIPLAAVISAIVLTVPLTLWFASIRATANTAESDNIKQEITIVTLQKDLSDIKADIREIKTVLKIKRVRE